MTRNHPSNPVTLKDTGYVPEVLYSRVLNVNMKPSGQGGPKKSKGGKRKWGRNMTGTMSKYRSSGGELRHERRTQRNIERQAMLKTRGAERRLNAMSRRLDRRVLKAASEMLDGLR
jgi:hypothetical protein